MAQNNNKGTDRKPGTKTTRPTRKTRAIAIHLYFTPIKIVRKTRKITT